MNVQNNNDRAEWLQGPTAVCSAKPGEARTPWRLVLLGAPGVGKGTQADLLHQRLGACHLSTGDVFRAAGKRSDCDQTPAMRAAVEYMRRGALVPDLTVWEMVRERSGCIACGGGFLLDGFPRTLVQAEALKQHMETEHLELTAVVNYELPLDEIVARLSGRRTCGECRSVFHLSSLPSRIDHRPSGSLRAQHGAADPVLQEPGSAGVGGGDGVSQRDLRPQRSRSRERRRRALVTGKFGNVSKQSQIAGGTACATKAVHRFRWWGRRFRLPGGVIHSSLSGASPVCGTI
jgi:adenylate kinase